MDWKALPLSLCAFSRKITFLSLGQMMGSKRGQMTHANNFVLRYAEFVWTEAALKWEIETFGEPMVHYIRTSWSTGDIVMKSKVPCATIGTSHFKSSPSIDFQTWILPMAVSVIGRNQKVVSLFQRLNYDANLLFCDGMAIPDCGYDSLEGYLPMDLIRGSYSCHGWHIGSYN